MRYGTKKQDNVIRDFSKRNRRLTAPQMTAVLYDERGTAIWIMSAGLRGCFAAKKSRLKIRYKSNRLEMAEAYEKLTIDHWENVRWSNELIFQVLGSRSTCVCKPLKRIDGFCRLYNTARYVQFTWYCRRVFQSIWPVFNTALHAKISLSLSNLQSIASFLRTGECLQQTWHRQTDRHA